MKTNVTTTAENKLAEVLLGTTLIEEADDCLITADRCWVFTQTDKPVLSSPRIGRAPCAIPSQFYWTVSTFKTVSGGRWHPDEEVDYEVAEAPSLWDAVKAAALEQAKWHIENVADNAHLADAYDADISSV